MLLSTLLRGATGARGPKHDKLLWLLSSPSLPLPCLYDSTKDGSININYDPRNYGAGSRNACIHTSTPSVFSLLIRIPFDCMTLRVSRTTVRCLSSPHRHCTTARLLPHDVLRPTTPPLPVRQPVLLAWSNFWSFASCVVSVVDGADVPSCPSDI